MTETKAPIHIVNEGDPNEAIAPIAVGMRKASALAISQDHMEEFATADEGPAEVSCARPPQTVFFTTCPETSKPWQNRRFYYWMEVEDYDIPFLVEETIAKKKKLAGETIIRPVLIVRYVTMAEVEGLWALKLDLDGKTNNWNKSAKKILGLADEGKWIRMLSGKGQYNHIVSPTTFEETPPVRSSRSFDDMIDNAFPEEQVVLDGSHEIWDVLARGKKKK